MSNERPLSPEIIRYREKWAKEPTSRVFAQLADAYRKEGMLDEAIRICLEGLKLHPTYVSARMILGRAYLEREALDGAAAEFERVLEISADNVLAHRMLGDTRRRQGRLGEAATHYEAVLALIALDRETRQLLAEVQANLAAGVPTPPTGAGTAASTPEIETAAPEVPALTPVEVPAPEFESVPAGALAAESPPAGPRSVSAPASGPAEAGELPATETLADLYAAQGHPEEAAAIYRELLTRAPDPRTLEPKLAAVEHAGRRTVPRAGALLAGAAATATVPSNRPGDTADSGDLLVTLTAWRDAVRATRRLRGAP